MGTARRQFTDEFKREAIVLLVSSGRRLSLGIAASMLRSWRDAVGAQIRRRRSRLPARIWRLKTPVYGARTSACAWSGRF
jgi:transposase-like protein